MGIQEELNKILCLEISTHCFETGEQNFSVDNASLEIGDGELRNVEIHRGILASVSESLKSFKNGVSGHNEIGDILALIFRL
jgi:hypothetical protein